MASDNITEVDIAKVSKDVILEFLELAIHSLLYARGLYPPGSFRRHKKYNVPVQICDHPDVRQYITKLLEGIAPNLFGRQIQVLSFVVLSPCRVPLERFNLEMAPAQGKTLNGDEILLRLEQSLREFLLKLSLSENMLTQLPDDCSWTVQIQTNESAALDLQKDLKVEDLNWIRAEESEVTMNTSQILPIKSLHSPLLEMQMYVEESSNKT